MSRRYACKHWFLVIIGVLASMIQGAILPIYGIFLSKMLFVLNHPDKIKVGVSPIDNQTPIYYEYDKQGKSNMWCFYMLLAALVALVSSFLKRFCFGIVGEGVTFQLRLDIFRKILG